MKRQIHFINTIQQIIRSDSVGVVGAVRRHLGWQARRLLCRFPCELSISHSRLFVGQPNGVAALVNCMGMYDFNNMSLLKLVLSAGAGTFVDVGANIGVYTLVASEVASASVLSIEPHPGTFAMLLRNVEGNSRSNVTCLKFVISDHEGTVSFTDRTGSSINRVLEPKEDVDRCIRVPCRTLDNTCSDLGIQPDFVKVDVEGHENLVLAGFHRFLPTTKVLLIEGGERAGAASVLNKAGFLGPVYFHFSRRTCAPFPQRRAEDPLFINERYLEDFKGVGVRV